jgi:hypothetical protein
MISSAKTHLNRYIPFLWGVTGYGSATLAVAPVSSDPTLQIWYDGQDSTQFNPAGTVGTNITQWTDKSSTAHNAAPIGNTGTRPLVTSSLATNNKLSLYFDGGDGLAAPMGSNLASKSGASIIVVAKANSATIGMQFIEGTIQSGGSYTDAGAFNIRQLGSTGYRIRMAGSTATTPTPADTNWHIFSLVFSGAGATNADKVKFYIDGVLQTLTFTVNANTTTSATIDSVLFGVDDTKAANFLTGFMGEVLVYNTTLTTTQQTATELYLKNKWALTY